ncbi:MAG: membrane protein insertion efficiency factor YidD [Chthoniobacterales bacterium]|nr:membrane protein insertion efficiency factor YidD [Chthoniobacterales bacterium]
MSAVREPRARRRWWIHGIVAAVLGAAAITDWTRAPERQASVYLYEHAVITPYRWVIRPMAALFIRCRYRPTCSQYSSEAVHTHGFPRGVWLTTKRLFRCMPWVPFGTPDPVPPFRAKGVSSAPGA